jgi:hypothetical protein
MVIPAETPKFVAREGLTRTIEYRPHLRMLYVALLSAGLGYGVLTLALSAFCFFKGSPKEAWFLLAYGLAIPFIFCLEAYFYVRPLAYTKVHVSPEGISVREMHRIRKIPYEEIEKVRFSHVPYMTGSFQIELKKRTRQKFTIALERSEYVLEAIASARPGLIDPEELLSYRRTAILADHSWARFYGRLKDRKSMMVEYVAAPFLTSVVAATIIKFDQIRDPLTFLTGWFLLFVVILAVNVGCGVFSWFGVNIAMVKNGRARLLADPTQVRRDMQLEARYHRIASFLHMAMLALIVAAMIAI